MCDQVQFDLSDDFENRSYKSFFAQSIVHSQYKQPISLDYQQLERMRNQETDDKDSGDLKKNVCRPSTPEIRLRRNTRSIVDDTRRYSCSNVSTARRSSLCSSRLTEIPVENIVNQSKIETLQWQLKEVRKSREMYRAVMKQVVTFLEKSHHSLELLGTRLNRRTPVVKRSRSEYQMNHSPGPDISNSPLNSTNGPDRTLNEHQLKNLQWKQNKPEEASPEEIPPEKLANEAFRLWRTAESLMNTQEPDLAPGDPENDEDFMEQLAKEFPQQPVENKPQRATSFNLSPKLIVPDADPKISTAFNRKLSLQLEPRRMSSKAFRNTDSARGSMVESDSESLCGRKVKLEKSNSPASGSISSVEDESGFSSMNSFQDVGLPLINSTMTEEVSTKNALLRSMLHNNSDYSSLNFPLNHENLNETFVPQENCEKRERKDSVRGNVEEIRLWQKPSISLNSSMSRSIPQHKRWYSSPVDETEINQSVKVLWV